MEKGFRAVYEVMHFRSGDYRHDIRSKIGLGVLQFAIRSDSAAPHLYPFEFAPIKSYKIA
jgi:hypothetical protein